MYTTQLLLLFLAVSSSLSTHVITVQDIFPEKLIKEAEKVSHNPDWGLDIVQYADKYGYPLESHEVITEDGYILTLHRIPYGRNEFPANGNKKPAILIVHGLLSSSMDFINMGPEKSIGLLLADQGYDVWLGNNRGNMWSRKHLSLNPDTDKKFWEFSFDECGYYDLPAMIDHILSTTGQDKISYIGHSQGTSQFFALTALRPEYNEKITIMLAFAPVAYMQNMTQLLMKYFVEYWSTIQMVADLLNMHEILPHTTLVKNIAKTMCNDGSEVRELCADILFFLSGYDSPQLNRSHLEVIMSNIPSGSSLQMIGHYVQEFKSGLFRRYDHGALKNLEVYHQFVPPNYKISSITAPVALYYGKNDLLTAVVDVEQLAEDLPNIVEKKLIEYELFTHLDFLWATDIDVLVNNDAIKLLNKYNQIGD